MFLGFFIPHPGFPSWCQCTLKGSGASRLTQDLLNAKFCLPYLDDGLTSALPILQCSGLALFSPPHSIFHSLPFFSSPGMEGERGAVQASSRQRSRTLPPMCSSLLPHRWASHEVLGDKKQGMITFPFSAYIISFQKHGIGHCWKQISGPDGPLPWTSKAVLMAIVSSLLLHLSFFCCISNWLHANSLIDISVGNRRLNEITSFRCLLACCLGQSQERNVERFLHQKGIYQGSHVKVGKIGCKLEAHWQKRWFACFLCSMIGLLWPKNLCFIDVGTRWVNVWVLVFALPPPSLPFPPTHTHINIAQEKKTFLGSLEWGRVIKVKTLRAQS